VILSGDFVVPSKPLRTSLLAASLLLSLSAYAADPASQPTQPNAASTTAVTTTSPTTETSSPLTGTVQAVQAAPTTALSAADYLDVQYTPGNSKHHMQQYTVVLNNKQDKHLQVLQLEVVNGISEQAYQQAQQQHAQASRRLAGGMLRGLTSVATSFVPYAGMGSIAAYQAVGVGSNALYNTANVIENSQGSVDYTTRIVQRANDIFISPKQSFQCLAVTPDKQPPVIKIVFKDLQSNQIYDLQK
jgi:hypothetical protein